MSKLIHEELSRDILAAAMKVHSTLNPGLDEKLYENALVVEFCVRKIPFRKGQKVGIFIPDLIAFDGVVIDTKVIDRITDHERGLMLNYLRITGLRVGVILNFKHRKLEWERIAL